MKYSKLTLLISYLAYLVPPLFLLAKQNPPLQPTTPLEVGQSYTLELPNGSILRQAFFRSQQGNTYLFEVPGIPEKISLTHFRVIPEKRPQPFLLLAAIHSALPINQPQLGFEQSLAADLQGITPLLVSSSPWLPQLTLRGGFWYLTGKRAVLMGPEVSLGPAWLWGRQHAFYLDLTAGAGFYHLRNHKIGRNYPQNTFLLQNQIGYLWRLGRWGMLLAVASNFIYDANYPLATSGLRLAAVLNFE